MKTFLAAALALFAAGTVARAETWTTYRIAESGTAVDIPVSLFTEDAGRPDGYGQRLRSADARADLTVQAVANREGLSPAQFLASKNPPSGIIYKRITRDFFVVSSVRADRIWYNRCNMAKAYVHCVLINYPAAEKRRWDGIVTRISRSLRAD